MKTERNTRPGLAACSSLLLLATAATSSAATLVLNDVVLYNATMNPPADLNPAGTLDWAYWASTSSNVGSSISPTNELSGGSIIGNLTSVGGGNLRGSSSSDTTGRYDWTGGATIPTGDNANLTGALIFNTVLNTEGYGVSFTLQGDPNATYHAILYLGGFAVDGVLNLSLNGAETITNTQTFGGGTKTVGAYHVTFRPDSVDDLLTVTFTHGSEGSRTSGSTHVGIEAVTVGVIPEPSAALLGGLGSLLLLGRRRR